VESAVSIDELLKDPRRRSYAAIPETDALTEKSGLQESDLVDAKFDLFGDSLAMLFDLRVSLGFRMANTAVLVMRQVLHLELSSKEPPGPERIAHLVMSSNPDVQDRLFTFTLGCLGGWSLNAIATSAEFFVGDIPNLPETPPDFSEGDAETVAAGMPSWDASFHPMWATFIDRHPSLELPKAW
jgi:hypothetical protein